VTPIGTLASSKFEQRTADLFCNYSDQRGQSFAAIRSNGNAVFVDVLRSYAAKRYTVHDFVVMRNQVHLLLTIDAEMALENAIGLIKGKFAFRAREEFGIKSAIWETRVLDVRVISKRSFLDCQKQIYANPVKAGLAKSAEEYPFCSAYFKKLKREAATA
jgi:REP element-mobilizing transposase RayT